MNDAELLIEWLTDNFVQQCRFAFGGSLVGVYLHGSAAMGCFDPRVSDIDLIVVVSEPPEDGVKSRFMKTVASLNKFAPAKGIEMSVVLDKYCKPFVYPTPFELHFSIAHLERFLSDPEGYIRSMNGTDKDLAAHFTIINHRGRALYGKHIREVFGEVPREDYLDSIINDISDARENIARDPMYVTLNLCRVLAFAREGLILSKAEGGKWGLEKLPAVYGGAIGAAAAAYAGEKAPAYPPPDELYAFADYALCELGL